MRAGRRGAGGGLVECDGTGMSKSDSENGHSGGEGGSVGESANGGCACSGDVAPSRASSDSASDANETRLELDDECDSGERSSTVGHHIASAWLEFGASGSLRGLGGMDAQQSDDDGDDDAESDSESEQSSSYEPRR